MISTDMNRPEDLLNATRVSISPLAYRTKCYLDLITALMLLFTSLRVALEDHHLYTYSILLTVSKTRHITKNWKDLECA